MDSQSPTPDAGERLASAVDELARIGALTVDERIALASQLEEASDTAADLLRLRLVCDENADVREKAMDAWWTVGGAGAALAARALLWDPDSCVADTAISALGELGDFQDVPRLIACLRHEDYTLRAAAAGSLGLLGYPAGEPALAEAMRNDPEPIVRRYAAFGMAFIDSEDVESVVEAALALETDDLARVGHLHALYVLAQRGRFSEFLSFLESDDSWMYGPVLQDIARDTRADDLPVALQAVRAALAAGPDAEKAARLRKAEEELVAVADDAPSVRRARPADRRQQPMKHPGPPNDEYLPQTGSHIDVDEDTLHNLRGDEPDAEALVRQGLQARATLALAEAADAVGRLGLLGYEPRLIELLQHRDALVRTCAVDSLGVIGTEAAHEPLTAALDDREALVRAHAGRALGDLGAPSATGALRHRLSVERSSYAKAGLLAGLHLLGDASALRGLARLLRSRQYRVRCYVANFFTDSASMADIEAVRSDLRAALDRDHTVAGREAISGTLARQE